MKINGLEFYVKPNSRKAGVEGIHGGRIKVRIKAPPEKGKANKELVDMISKVTGVSKDRISIKAGITSNYKRVVIESEKSLDYSKVILGSA